MPSITIKVPKITIPDIPIAAALKGGDKAISAELSGPGGKALDLGLNGAPIGLEAGFRNNTVQFKLFGFILLLMTKIR